MAHALKQTAPLAEDVHVRLRSDPRLLRAVRSLVRCYFADLGFSEARCLEIMLAVDEACTNAIRHSYRGMEPGPIVLSLAANEEWAAVGLCDEGQPAPPDRVCRQEIGAPASADDIEPGGLGVQLIYRVFDEVAYTPGMRSGNCVTMRLRRPA